MRFRLRTLLILLAIGPPIIGYWPAIQKNAVSCAATLTASDVAVVAAVSSIILIRVRLERKQATAEPGFTRQSEDKPI
jgi:hypothetical protein